MKKIIVWFRKDLRVHDNPVLWEAAKQGIIIPVFILSEEEERENATSAAGQWWLHHSLSALEKKLKSIGLTLIFRRGSSLEELTTICEQTKADAVFYSERHEPSLKRRDNSIAKNLLFHRKEVRSFPSNLLFTTSDLLNQKNEPYKVFTAFWKRTMRESVSRPLPMPVDVVPYSQVIPSMQLEELGLLSINRWEEKFQTYWEPGEKGAITRWEQFTDDGLSRYVEGRDIPSADSVSLLSPHLAWGEISVRAIWHSAKRLIETDTGEYMHSSIDAFLRQLIWREFAYHQLIHFPAMLHAPIREKFKVFPWQGSDE